MITNQVQKLSSDESNRSAFSPLEVAIRWGKTRQHIYNLLARGELKSFKSGRSRLIPATDIKRIEGCEL